MTTMGTHGTGRHMGATERAPQPVTTPEHLRGCGSAPLVSVSPGGPAVIRSASTRLPLDPMFGGRDMWPLINDVETGRTPEYPDLVPQRFAAPPTAVLEAVEATARSLPRWSVTGIDRDQGVLDATFTTLLLRFRDDITVRVVAEGEATTVSVRSRSRIGKGDLGQNARTIRAFQAALAQRLG